jgi:hypothetical protein
VAAPEARVAEFRRRRRLKRVIPLAAAAVAVVVFVMLTFQPIQLFQTRSIENAKIRGPFYLVETRRDMLAVGKETNFGVENIYIVKWNGYDPNKNLVEQPESWENVITRSGQWVEIPPGRRFEIVVAVRAEAPKDILRLGKEYLWVELKTTGAFEVDPLKSLDTQEFVFENVAYEAGGGLIRVNVVWDNNHRGGGEGYELGEGEYLYIENASLGTGRPYS